MSTFVNLVRSVLGAAPTGGELLEYMFAGLFASLVVILCFKLILQLASMFSRH